MTRPHTQLRGFTLIELILVLIILSIMVALASPSLRGWGQGQKLKNATDEFLAATGNAKARAVAAASPFAVQINSTDNTFAVKSIEPGGVRKAVPGEFGETTTLPTDFTLKLVTGGATPSPGSGVAAGESVILFYPDARCTPAAVEITSPNGDVAKVESLSPAEPFKKVDTSK